MAHDYSNLSLSQLIEKLNFYDLINKLKEIFKKLKNQVDTNTSTIQTLEETVQNSTLPYKSYIALVSQTGTNDPEAIELFNNIGEFTMNRLTSGTYYITLPYSVNKDNLFVVAPLMVNDEGYMLNIGVEFIDNNTISLSNMRDLISDTPAVDGFLFKNRIEIRLYE